MRKLAMILVCAAAMNASAQISESTLVSIQVDLAKPQGPYTPIYSWFGYDESNYTTMKYGKLLLTELHNLSPVPVYIRAHHLLTSGNGVAELKWSSSNVFTLDANGKPVYDFTTTDQTFDEFQKAGVRPMVELGFALFLFPLCCYPLINQRQLMVVPRSQFRSLHQYLLNVLVPLL
jgi:xylan 1,4-beta-xylosidase